MATPLQRSVSDADRCVIRNSPWTGVDFRSEQNPLFLKSHKYLLKRSPDLVVQQGPDIAPHETFARQVISSPDWVVQQGQYLLKRLFPEQQFHRRLLPCRKNYSRHVTDHRFQSYLLQQPEKMY